LTFLGAYIPLAAGGVASMGRNTAALFPLYLWAAAVTPQRAWALTLAASLASQRLVAALFFSWRSMYQYGAH
jgi:hypothetical protein